MSKIVEVLQEQPPEKLAEMQRLMAVATDSKLPMGKRMSAALILSDLGSPLIIESIRRELPPVEPRYEYRYIRGARTRVRVN